MTPEQSSQLDALESFVVTYQRAGRTRRQFWDEFIVASGDFERLAFGDDADGDLSNRYFEILDFAHECYGCSPEREDEVMEG